MSTEHSYIVIVTSEFPPQPGGIGNHAFNLANHLSNKGFKIKVIADVRSNDGRDETEFDNSLAYSVIRIKKRSFRFIMYLKRIWKTYKSLKHASVVIATGKFSLWNVALSNTIYKKKSIAIVHGTEVNFKTLWLKKSIDKSLKHFDKIVAVSHYTKSLISHLKKEVVVIPNGITLSEWNVSEIDDVNLKGNPVLTTVGRVSSRKGQLNVIKLLPQVLKTFPNLHYHCVGIPTEAEFFKEIASQLDVASNITFHGSVNDANLKEMLKATDVFVMLSTESTTGDVEGFGIAILEANALGIPAIGSQGCGIEDAVQIERSGFIIDPKSDIEFSNSIKRILASQTEFNSGANKWAKQHDWNQIVERYIALF